MCFFLQNNPFTAHTRTILPIVLAFQVTAIKTKYSSTIITAANIVISSIKAIFTMLFGTALTFKKWHALLAPGYTAVVTCLDAKLTYVLFTTFTFSQLPTLFAYAMDTDVTHFHRWIT